MSQKQDEKTREIVIDAMTTVMMPVLDKLFDEVSTIRKDVSVLKKDVSVLKDDVSILKEDVHDLQLTTSRIETL